MIIESQLYGDDNDVNNHRSKHTVDKNESRGYNDNRK